MRYSKSLKGLKYNTTFIWLIILSYFMGGCSLNFFNNQEQYSSHKPQLRLDDINTIHSSEIIPVFQPTVSQEKIFSTSIDASQGSPRNLKVYGNDYQFILKDNFPYYKYWGMAESNMYVVHPMMIGRYILKNLSREDFKDRNKKEINGIDIKKTVKSILDISVPLPNGGLAWYYPRYYKNNRMVGPDITYSAISQAELLSAFLKLQETFNENSYSTEIKQIVESFYFPYEKGGISLEDKALLEFPLYRSAPEIILNGWLHALLSLSDYVALHDDEKAKELLTNNLIFLAETISNYDAPQYQLSRYSDLSPYKVKIAYKNNKESEKRARFKIIYLPKDNSLKNSYKVTLSHLENPSRPSVYDNQILRKNNNIISASITCSQNYKTLIFSEAQSFTLSLFSGEYNFDSSTPGNRGEEIVLESQPQSSGKGSFIDLSLVDESLICGYPTNFSKEGNINFYHVHHTVALIYLAHSTPMPREVRDKLLLYALKWHEYTQKKNLPKKIKFEDPQKVLDSINGGKTRIISKDFNELLEWAKSSK